MLTKFLGMARRRGPGIEPSTTVLEEVEAKTSDAEIFVSASELTSAGRYAEALTLVDAVLARHPDDVSSMFARGSTLFEWARFHEAQPWLLKAISRGLDHPLLFLQAGWCCLWTTGASSGEPWMRRAVERAPDDWLVNFGLGSCLRAQGRTEEAVACFERALACSGGEQASLLQLFDCRHSQNRFQEAEVFARRAIDADPTNPQAWTTLGIALVSQDLFADALQAFEQGESLAVQHGGGDPHLNLAICLRETGRLADAAALYERNLPERPSIGAYAHYGHALLAGGRLAEGWMQYEFRWMQEPLLSLRLPVAKPVWDGQKLAGRTILLRCEQGVGDVIQFIRYAPHVKALGPTVLLQLRKNIRELATRFPGVDRIIDVGESLPDFDYYIHLMSLPRVFATDIDSVPADVPYLEPDPVRVERWRKTLQAPGAFKVGLVWAGDPNHLRDRQRSIPLAALAPLWDVPGVRFFSLQKGPQARHIAHLSPQIPLVDLGQELRDFADTAAVLSRLDLVVCVDTSVAHLAGALGKPVWMLIPRPSDWRWLEGRDTSPWYPSMRLFRQVRQGDWKEVIDRVRGALPAAVEAQRSPESGSGPVLIRMAIEAPHDEPSGTHKPGFTAVAETRVGILQYWPLQDPAGRSIARYGEFLQSQLDVLVRWLAPDATVLEAGAGVGIHSIALASALGSGGHLLLYEDDPVVRQVLRQNLAVNGIANVTVMKRRLRAPASGNGSRSPGSDDPNAETVDDLRLGALQWLKVNDPAAAQTILTGAVDTLWRLRPRLWLASRDVESVNDLAMMAMDFGYRCFHMKTPLFNPENFNRRDVDVFEGRMFSALLAIPEEVDADVTLAHCAEL